VAGELVYFVVNAADAERAKGFYGELFGWEFAEGNVPGGFQITNTEPPGGLFGGSGASAPKVWFKVDDINEGIERVRALGGEAGEPEEIASGFMASCRDDQGSELNLWAPKPGT
jgi:predicted enzyme related to lactoylglutathione lyase